jgi:hypothetical protein
VDNWARARTRWRRFLFEDAGQERVGGLIGVLGGTSAFVECIASGCFQYSRSVGNVAVEEYTSYNICRAGEASACSYVPPDIGSINEQNMKYNLHAFNSVLSKQ